LGWSTERVHNLQAIVALGTLMMMSVRNLLLLCGATCGMRPGVVERQLGLQGEMIQGMATKLLEGSADSLVALREVERMSGELARRVGNATDHLSDADTTLIQQVIDVIRDSMYESMNTSHDLEKGELNTALARVNQCNSDMTDSLAATGTVGILLAIADGHQSTYDDLEVEKNTLTTLEETTRSALTSHTINLPDAPSCERSPQKEPDHLKLYFESNDFVDWYQQQSQAFDQKYGVHKLAKDQLTTKKAELFEKQAELRGEYCAFSLVLQATCLTHGSCYETELLDFSQAKTRISNSATGRASAFESGEKAIAHLEFLIGTSETPDAGQVDSSRYAVDIPADPALLACAVSQPDWADAVASTCDTHVSPGDWVLLAEGLTYTGTEVSAAASPLHFGEFTVFKAVYRSGPGIACGQGFSSEYKWQVCNPSLGNAWSFELKKNDDYVVSQPAWNTLPTECAIPSTPTGDIVCYVRFNLKKGDTLTAGWLEPFRSISTSNNAGSIKIDIYGMRAPWVKLAEDLTYTGTSMSAAVSPFRVGDFVAFKAVYRGGPGIACNSVYSSEYKWQMCNPSRPNSWSFELKKNDDYVVSQPNWHTLPTECAIPSTPTGDIVCGAGFHLEQEDTLTAGWYEPSRQWQLTDNAGSITVAIYGMLSPWLKLAEDLTYTGTSVSAAASPLHVGEFRAFKAVYRSGPGIACNSAHSSEYKWQVCNPSHGNAWSFELKKNDDYVVSQLHWNTLPAECAIPSTPTGDIVCDVRFNLGEGDTLTAGWLEPFRSISTSNNGGSITIDIFGMKA